ncbi:putative uronyl 2-sulfotransferase [Apostichopus japonicus]|uniref:Putative uronyl 2-sulfotransferase n=1 Tax=Stichopus japonicus TaxID=307972 RepID=A0A2G8LQB1_STIJA|nr:putative uronyl 2-sulfotransferase [Apostichopus japonicus]
MKQDTSGTHRRVTPISIATAVTESHETKIQKAVHGKNLVVLYNAVPKTGSRTFEHLVREYASRRTKKYIKPITFPQNLTKDTGQLKGFLTSLDSGSFVRGHFPYTSINRTDVSVVYINSVRDPVERLISNYYFDIYGDGETDTGHQRHAYLQYHEQTIDECIEKKGNCFNFVYQYYKRQTFYIFCGNQPFCKLYNRETLKKAKQNLDNYLLVYDVKEFDNMISMIQKMLPDYFYDVVTALKHIKSKMN